MKMASPTTAATVFVVDDDPSIREALNSLIRSVKLRVVTFSSAQEFLRYDRPEAPACLVLDIRLHGLNGLELQQQLIRDGVQLPIIFITGHGDIPMSVRAMKAGAVEFLTKPFRERQLLRAIEQAASPLFRHRKIIVARAHINNKAGIDLEVVLYEEPQREDAEVDLICETYGGLNGIRNVVDQIRLAAVGHIRVLKIHSPGVLPQVQTAEFERMASDLPPDALL